MRLEHNLLHKRKSKFKLNERSSVKISPSAAMLLHWKTQVIMLLASSSVAAFNPSSTKAILPKHQRLMPLQSSLSPLSLHNLHGRLKMMDMPEVDNCTIEDNMMIETTLNWVDRFVIKHGMCPFAVRNNIRTVVCHTTEPEARVAFVEEELERLHSIHPERSLSTLILLPELVDVGFFDFSIFAAFLTETTFEKYEVHLVAFHPNATVDEEKLTSQWDARVFSQRSPYPMLHLLRNDEVDVACNHLAKQKSLEDRTAAAKYIRERNVKYLHRLGWQRAEEANKR